MEPAELKCQITKGLAPGWLEIMEPWFEGPDFLRLSGFLQSEWQRGCAVGPEPVRFLRALQFSSPRDIRAVILGQDPYPTPGHATGLSFGMQNRAGPLPRSLRNIYQEVSTSFDISVAELEARGSDLTGWAQQGVLLLNTVLSVRLGPDQAGSHRGKGWEALTDIILQSLNQQPQRICFLLWGKPAQEKRRWITSEKHCVLEAVHPSPLSAYRGFFGCNHFKLANEFLTSFDQTPSIDWTRVSDSF